MLIISEKEIAEKWGKYYDKLLNCEKQTKKFIYYIKNINTQECLNSTLEEIKLQVQRLKNHKSLEKYCVQA